MAGSQSAGSSSGWSSRTLPRFDSRMPASTMPATLVFLDLESCSATPYSPSAKPNCSNQVKRPTTVGVEVTFLFGQRLVECLVDERQRVTHCEWLALGVENLGVAGVDRHARANGGLCEVDWRDVAALQVCESAGQFGLERANKLAARGGGRASIAPAADEDDAGGECVSACTNHAIARFQSALATYQLIANPASNHRV